MSAIPSDCLGSKASGNAGQYSGLPRQMPRRWSRRLVIQAINERARTGQCLEHTWRQDRPLFRAAVNHFGNWTKAMLAAGQTPLVRESWSRARVIERLQVFQKRYGNIDVSQVEPRLADAARRLFGSIETARRVGQELSVDAVRVQDASLYEIACEEFGAWETALEYAGVDARLASNPSLPWNRQSVIKQLRRLCRSGYDLNAHINRTRDRRLYDATRHYFGSWRAGLAAAGINLAHVNKRGLRQLSAEAMILWLQERHQRGQSLVWTEVAMENRDQALSIKRQFGSWRKALVEAGLDGK